MIRYCGRTLGGGSPASPSLIHVVQPKRDAIPHSSQEPDLKHDSRLSESQQCEVRIRRLRASLIIDVDSLANQYHGNLMVRVRITSLFTAITSRYWVGAVRDGAQAFRVRQSRGWVISTKPNDVPDDAKPKESVILGIIRCRRPRFCIRGVVGYMRGRLVNYPRARKINTRRDDTPHPGTIQKREADSENRHSQNCNDTREITRESTTNYLANTPS